MANYVVRTLFSENHFLSPNLVFCGEYLSTYFKLRSSTPGNKIQSGGNNQSKGICCYMGTALIPDTFSQTTDVQMGMYEQLGVYCN